MTVPAPRCEKGRRRGQGQAEFEARPHFSEQQEKRRLLEMLSLVAHRPSAIGFAEIRTRRCANRASGSPARRTRLPSDVLIDRLAGRTTLLARSKLEIQMSLRRHSPLLFPWEV